MKSVSIDAVSPSSYNPRKADPRRLDVLELSLKKLGWLLPIFADQNGEILSGHQRHHVAQRMGLESVPVETTPAMDLATRKAVNVVFNRGTNDLDVTDTPKNITEALASIDLDGLASNITDKTEMEMMRCLSAKPMSVHDLASKNKGRWVPYARNLARVLAGKKISMPIVCTPDGVVVNGIGRLQLAAERKESVIQVVTISHDEADLAGAMLNLLSMDFDIHTRYRDMLRYNSFRRARRVRDSLGRGFVFAAIDGRKGPDIDLSNPAHVAKWKKVYGGSVVDFGAGHLHETNMLRKAGIHVNPFEPYRLGKNNSIDKKESVAIAMRFLSEIATGKQYSSVFISSVLNSVPFADDRSHIVCICAALCSGKTRLYAAASSTNQARFRNLMGAKAISHDKASEFSLDYESGIQLGDFQDKPKIQKYHTQKEFYYLFSSFFEKAKINEQVNNVQAVCANPRPTDKARLIQAIEFEFNLPYPEGGTMGLVEEAIKAFKQRGVL